MTRPSITSERYRPIIGPQGSDTLYLAAQYVERMARAFGLDSVALIMQPSKRATWNPGTADLWLVGQDGAATRTRSRARSRRICISPIAAGPRT